MKDFDNCRDQWTTGLVLTHISAMSPAIFLANYEHTHFLFLITPIMIHKSSGVDSDNNIFKN